MSRLRAAFYLMDETFCGYTEKIHDFIEKIATRKKGETLIIDFSVIEALQKNFPRFLMEELGIAGSRENFLELSLTEEQSEKIRGLIIQAREALFNLLRLPAQELKARYDEAKSIQHREVEERRKNNGEKADLFEFFAEPKASANFNKWLIQPIWELEEAVALSLGKEPSIVNSDSLQDVRSNGPAPSQFRLKYEERLQILNRAIIHELETPIRPASFVKWCEGKGFDLPAELKTIQTERNDETYEEILFEIRTEKAQVERENVQLRKELDAYKASIDDINPRAKRSLHLMVLIMALKKFDYAIDGRTEAATAISNAFADYGLTIHRDTVKDRLDDIKLDSALAGDLKKIRKAIRNK